MFYANASYGSGRVIETDIVEISSKALGLNTQKMLKENIELKLEIDAPTKYLHKIEKKQKIQPRRVVVKMVLCFGIMHHIRH